MENNWLISIIVPVYNMERYLDECIQSVLKQTYTNFELILVDDGSRDRSGSMLDEWSEKDLRIKVIHKKNGGISSARNAGLDVAKGEYIAFVDSDDYVAENYLEVLLNRCLEEDADISSCKVINLYKNASYSEGRLPREKVVIEKDIYMERIYTYGLYTLVWNKLYKRHLFDEIRFTEGRTNEDAIIIPKLIVASNKVAHTPEALYFYRRRQSSIMNDKNRDRIFLSELAWISDDIESYSENGQEYLCKLAQKLMFNKILEYYNEISTDVRRDMKRKLLSLSRELKSYPGFSTKTRMKILVTAYLPRFYGKYYSHKNKSKVQYDPFE